MTVKSIVLGVLCCTALEVIAETPDQQLVDAAIDHAFVPSATELLKSADQLLESVQSGCRGEIAQQSFNALVGKFSIFEYYRLGQINHDNRAERLFFWPDRKGTGQKQLRRLLADPARGELNAVTLAKKSVALQGLPALERILFGMDRQLSTEDCVVAHAIAGNIQLVVNEVYSDWVSDNGIAWQLRQTRPDSLYRSDTESVAAVLTVVEAALLSMVEKKLPLLINSLDSNAAIPKTAPFWLSKQTLQNLHGNLTGIERLLINSGLAAFAEVDEQVLFEVNTGISMLDAADAALSIADVQTARKRLVALQINLRGMSTTIVDVIASKLGVATGFNAEDGD